MYVVVACSSFVVVVHILVLLLALPIYFICEELCLFGRGRTQLKFIELDHQRLPRTKWYFKNIFLYVMHMLDLSLLCVCVCVSFVDVPAFISYAHIYLVGEVIKSRNMCANWKMRDICRGYTYLYVMRFLNIFKSSMCVYMYLQHQVLRSQYIFFIHQRIYARYFTVEINVE